MLAAAHRYRKPLALVRTIFIWGANGVPPIGQRDAFDVWWARPADLQLLLGCTAPANAFASSAERRATARAAQLRAKLQAAR